MAVKKILEKDELTAIHFWVLNQKYMCYLEEFECDDDTYSEKEFDREFGRSLAHKIYEPQNSDLEHGTFEELKFFLCDFASEFDLSLLDEYTYEHIIEVIDNYCSSNNPLPVFQSKIITDN